jgi:recombination protein RecA
MSLQSALNKIYKKYGKEVITRGIKTKKEFWSTGISVVDWALTGGIAKGIFVELFGVPSSGKSSLALRLIAQAQKQGAICAYIDIEDTISSDWNLTLGVDNDNLLVLNRQQVEESIQKGGNEGINAETVLQLMIDLLETKEIDILVLDSIAALVPKDEHQKTLNEEAKIAGVAKILTRALRVMNAKNARRTTVLFINQLRDNMGYGGGATTPGGRAVKHATSQRINFKRGKNVSKGDEVIGYECKIICEKNKVGVPYRQAQLVFNNDGSFDRFAVYWNLAKNLGMYGDGVEVAGRTYTYNGEVVAKSQGDFEEWLKGKPDVFELLEKSLVEASKGQLIKEQKEIVLDVAEKTEEQLIEEIKLEEANESQEKEHNTKK